MMENGKPWTTRLRDHLVLRAFTAAPLRNLGPPRFGAAVPNPTPADALAITYSLRVEGDLRARRLAEQIEQACRLSLEFRARFFVR
jgi:hypothetical protein